MKVILNNEEYRHTSKKAVCVGRNFLDHAVELKNAVPSEPVLFIKPATSLVSMSGEIKLSRNYKSVHHELELAVLIGKRASNISEKEVEQYIAGVGLALDLTLRDVQAQLKQKSLPWELAKGFDSTCPVSRFISLPQYGFGQDWQITLIKNGDVQQQGGAGDMLFSIPLLLAYISRHFTLEAGDIVLTGTPAGVSALQNGDQLESSLKLRERLLLSEKTSVCFV